MSVFFVCTAASRGKLEKYIRYVEGLKDDNAEAPKWLGYYSTEINKILEKMSSRENVDADRRRAESTMASREKGVKTKVDLTTFATLFEEGKKLADPDDDDGPIDWDTPYVRLNNDRPKSKAQLRNEKLDLEDLQDGIQKSMDRMSLHESDDPVEEETADPISKRTTALALAPVDTQDATNTPTNSLDNKFNLVALLIIVLVSVIATVLCFRPHLAP